MSTRQRILCKFFAQGTCLKGEYCRFSHDSTDQPNNICTYYQQGNCIYGRRCRFEHVKAAWSASSSSDSSMAPRQSIASGPVRNSATKIPFSPSKPSASNSGLLQSAETLDSFHQDPASASEEEEKKHIEALKRSEEIECCVCLDRVLSKPIPAEQRFGLMSECDHPFCITCIRNWRNTSSESPTAFSSTKRNCPVCRKLSYFVVPSESWYSTPEEKQEIIDKYKGKLRLIDCKHFKSGNGNCPFGASCFYKHTVKPGSYTWLHNRPPPPINRPLRIANAMSFLLEQILSDDEFDFLNVDDDESEAFSALDIADLLMRSGLDPTDDSSSDDDGTYAYDCVF